MDKEVTLAIAEIGLTISIIGLLFSFFTLYFNFIKPARIRLLVGNTCTLYYADYIESKKGFGIYLPIDFTNTSNRTGIIIKTAIVLYNKNHPKERFLMQQKQFSKLDTVQNKWVYDEMAHSVVIAPKSSINKIISYFWSMDSIPEIKLQKGEYEIKVYYWLNQNKKPKFIKCDLYIDNKIEALINSRIQEKSNKVITVILNKEFDYNKFITETEEKKLLG
jgi:hypothetical protein